MGITERREPISPKSEQSYVTWDDEKGRALAFKQVGDAYRKVEPILRSQASEVFFNIAPHNVSVRDSYSRGDYEYMRRSEALPQKPKEIIRACMDAYDGVGIIRNVIDLMADFTVQGINILHPNERVEKFYQEWFRKVNGPERSERFANLFYRTGNVIVQRQTAKLTIKNEEDLRRSSAEADINIEPPPKVGKREVPWRYNFLNPLAVELLVDELPTFLGTEGFLFGIRLNENLIKKIKSPRNALEKDLVNRIPDEILKYVRTGNKVIPLKQDKVSAHYYKRDDWHPWAKPMVYSILADINMLQKMKLADLSALDGAISSIRVWRLGNLEAKILPTEQTILRLAQMLNNNVGGGVMDLVWGPDIDLVETKTDVHHFLGNIKYEPVLTAIYAGLGVPPTLTGAHHSGGGFTNNYISLKTLTERLEYGRASLRAFWDYEIRLVQQAMGFRFPAQVTFDRMVLSDESAEKQLLINMADRDLISIETIQERFGELPEIEEMRIRREKRKREKGDIPEKASPFHDPQQDFSLEKIFAQQGTVTPSQVGLELEENKDGEKTLTEQTADQAAKQAKLQMQSQTSQNDHQFRTEKLQLKHGVHPGQLQQNPVKKGQPGQGRPKQSNDTKKRKQKQVKPRSAAFVAGLAKAEASLGQVSDILTKPFLSSLGKKSLRELTDEEGRNFETLKFAVLCQFSGEAAVSGEAVGQIIQKELRVPVQTNRLLSAAIQEFVKVNGREPPVEVLRRFQASVYSLWTADLEDEDEAGDSTDDSSPVS